jgi:hypothetical protein
MKFVDRREIERRQMCEILPLFRQLAQDGIENLVAGVVVGNGVAHAISEFSSGASARYYYFASALTFGQLFS